jgi:hypothetical protein
VFRSLLVAAVIVAGSLGLADLASTGYSAIQTAQVVLHSA